MDVCKFYCNSINKHDRRRLDYYIFSFTRLYVCTVTSFIQIFKQILGGAHRPLPQTHPPDMSLREGSMSPAQNPPEMSLREGSMSPAQNPPEIEY